VGAGGSRRRSCRHLRGSGWCGAGPPTRRITLTASKSPTSDPTTSHRPISGSSTRSCTSGSVARWQGASTAGLSGSRSMCAGCLHRQGTGPYSLGNAYDRGCAVRGDHSEALTLLNWPDALVRIAGPGPACHIQADSGAKIRRRHLVCHWPRPRWFDCQRAIVECAISPDSLYWCATGRPRRQVVFARLPRSGPPTGSPPRRSYRRRHRNSSSLPPRNRRQSLALRTPCGRPIQLKPQSCSAAPLLPRSAGLPIFKVAAPAVEPLVRGCLRTVRRRLPRHGQR
jgi:hypothetical protein